MEISLENRVAIVTGGGSGLGRGFAIALASAGARVAVTGRRTEPLEECVSEIEKVGGQALAVSCDVRSREAVEAAVAKVIDWGEKIDILVNNAAVFPNEGLTDTDIDSWEEQFAINLRAPFFLCQAFPLC